MTPEELKICELRVKILAIYVPISAKLGIENGTVLNLAEDAYKFVTKEIPTAPGIMTHVNSDTLTPLIPKGKVTSKRRKK